MEDEKKYVLEVATDYEGKLIKDVNGSLFFSKCHLKEKPGSWNLSKVTFKPHPDLKVYIADKDSKVEIGQAKITLKDKAKDLENESSQKDSILSELNNCLGKGGPINNLSEEIGKINSMLTDLTNSISTLKEEITKPNLNERLNKIEESIDTLEDNNEEIKDKIKDNRELIEQLEGTLGEKLKQIILSSSNELNVYNDTIEQIDKLMKWSISITKYLGNAVIKLIKNQEEAANLEVEEATGSKEEQAADSKEEQTADSKEEQTVDSKGEK